MIDRALFFKFDRITTDHHDNAEGWIGDESLLIYEMDPGEVGDFNSIIAQTLYPCYADGAGDYVVEYADLWRLARTIGWDKFTPPPAMAARVEKLRAANKTELTMLAMKYRIIGSGDVTDIIHDAAKLAGLLEPDGKVASDTWDDITECFNEACPVIQTVRTP